MISDQKQKSFQRFLRIIRDFLADFLNLAFGCLVFTHLVYQLAGRELRLCIKATCCQHIRIVNLVNAVFVVACLQPAFINLRLQTVIGLAETDLHRFGKLARADIGVFFDELEKPVGDFFVHLCIICEPDYPIVAMDESLQAGYRHTALYMRGGYGVNPVLFLPV